MTDTIVAIMLRRLQIMVEGTREKHFRVHDDLVMPDDPRMKAIDAVMGRYTGPLCTEQKPCDRCRENEEVK